MNKRWLHAINQAVVRDEIITGAEIKVPDRVHLPIEIKVKGKTVPVQTTQGGNFCPINFNAWESGNYYHTNGLKVDDPSRVRLKELLPVTPSSKLYLGTNSERYKFALRTYDDSGAFVRDLSGIINIDNITLKDTDYYISVTIAIPTAKPPGMPTYNDYEIAFASREIAPFICLSNVSNPENTNALKSIGDSGRLNIMRFIGSRNLLSDTNKGQTGWDFFGNATRKWDSPQALGILAAKLIITNPSTNWAVVLHTIQRNLIKNGTQYTLSLDIYPDVEIAFGAQLLAINFTRLLCDFGKKICPAKTWTHIELTGETTNNYGTNQVLYITGINEIGSFIFANLKITEGAVAGNWTPAFEDLTSDSANQYKDKLSIAMVNFPAPLRSLPNGIHDVLECKDGVWGIERNVSNEIIFPPRGTSGEYSIQKNGSVRRNWVNNHNYRCGEPDQISIISENYAADTWEHLKNGSNTENAPYAICGWHYEESARFDVMVPEAALETKDAAGLTKYLTENPPLFYAQLSKPIWETLDTASQKSLNNLLSYSDKCYIYTTDPIRPNIEVTAKVLGR